MPKINKGKSLYQIRGDLEALLENATKIAATEAVRHFKGSFRNQGFTDSSLRAWKKRKDNRDSDRAILVKSGRLRRGVKVLQLTNKTAKVGVDLSEVPYAQYHNDGGIQHVRAHKRRTPRGRRSDRDGAYAQVKPHSRKVPKRQFIGNSQVLNQNIDKKIAKEITKILK